MHAVRIGICHPSLCSRPKKERARVSPSRALVLSCANYFQAPATQTMLPGSVLFSKKDGGAYRTD